MRQKNMVMRFASLPPLIFIFHGVYCLKLWRYRHGRVVFYDATMEICYMTEVNFRDMALSRRTEAAANHGIASRR